MRTLDLRSFVTGLCVGVVAVLAMAMADGDAGTRRFRIAPASNSSACFVIDSATGELWLRDSAGGGQPLGGPAQWQREAPGRSR